MCHRIYVQAVASTSYKVEQGNNHGIPVSIGIFSFCCNSDLVDGLIRLMNSNFSQPVNLGNPEEHSILEFAKLVQQHVGMWSL